MDWNENKAYLLKRFDTLRDLGEDHGGEGEPAPSQISIDNAVRFVNEITSCTINTKLNLKE